MSNELTGFLMARLDEEAAVADTARRQVAERQLPPVSVDEWAERAGHWTVVPWLFTGRVEVDLAEWGRLEIATVAKDHIALHDPARVLSEVDAKRRIAECHEAWVAENGDIICGRCGREHIDGRPGGHFPCQTLRLLALPYAGHPDYREEWKP